MRLATTPRPPYTVDPVSSSIFVPSAAPPESAEGAVYVVFHGDLVLMHEEALVSSPASLGIHAERTFYLGTWKGRPTFALAAKEPPRNLPFVPLRAALLQLDADRFGVLACGAQILGWDRDHRFCGRCGAPLDEVPGERARRCAVCKLDAYPRISPCAIVLVHDQDRVLLAHRPRAPFFSLVAGFLEAGETLEECAAREVREETGISVDSVRYFGSQPWPFPHQLMVAFCARYTGGEITVDNRELDEARFFRRNELPPLPPPLSIARRMIDAWYEGRMPPG